MGSVKTTIHEAVRAAGLENQFIGGHPMAGSERVGFVNSRASLLENAYYILTPSPGISSGQVDAFKTLITGMGAIPLVLDYKQHDYVTAAVSHLPHVIASSLVHLVEDSDSKDGIMKMIAAGGFKDITRIASSSAAMWQQICLTNTENIVALLDSYMDALGKIRTELVNRNPMPSMIFLTVPEFTGIPLSTLPAAPSKDPTVSMWILQTRPVPWHTLSPCLPKTISVLKMWKLPITENPRTVSSE